MTPETLQPNTGNVKSENRVFARVRSMGSAAWDIQGSQKTVGGDDASRALLQCGSVEAETGNSQPKLYEEV